MDRHNRQLLLHVDVILMSDIGVDEQLFLLDENLLVFFSETVSGLCNPLSGLKNHISRQLGDGLDMLQLHHQLVGQVALSFV